MRTKFLAVATLILLASFTASTANANPFAVWRAVKAEFNVLDGKLKVGTIKKTRQLEIKGGEINAYKAGTVGSAAVYCGVTNCQKPAGPGASK
ncbi:outer membrane lipoprotein SlyB [Bradyrhizobium japonicum]|uniref:hypothetical protein n=1 Tax=Bradyrhizobium japonicum TaxID=375 RepID=UPI00222609F0|nr:hypothetical protein [Bradyrhizobium japonicum]MCW2218299.1 outer membrane lipoprotein SlyB [Bradyrhizobium japonicum]MCW2342913.1 outer membrane lipoprotein SlyB [Bradyrhizobium japonicum]